MKQKMSEEKWRSDVILAITKATENLDEGAMQALVASFDYSYADKMVRGAITNLNDALISLTKLKNNHANR